MVSVATQVEFSPRYLPKDQSLLSYDSDGSIATDPGYSSVHRSGRVVEQAVVVVETSPNLLEGRVSEERLASNTTISNRGCYVFFMYGRHHMQ